ncbi:hypothetical protein PV326_008877 [Microctonus aethiopoides]|nr:hypothetical protein PV326_008877 [Microctonus aethiopoides]
MGGRATHPQEREAEKLSDEGGLQVRDVKSEITPAKNLNVWHGNTFYPHLNTIKVRNEVFTEEKTRILFDTQLKVVTRGADGHSHDRTILDCSACRPRAVFYSQVNRSPAPMN